LTRFPADRFNGGVNAQPEPDPIASARAVLEIEINELRRLADRIGEPFAEAVRLLRDALGARQKIVVIGVGKSENIATKIAATLNSTGAPSVLLDCQNALHGDLGLVTPGDAVIALSYSGETAELLDLLPHLKRRAVRLIAFTGRTDSTLAGQADIVLDVNVETEACPLNLAPTSSTTNMLALGDALAMVLLKTRGFRAEDFAELHPGGHLGRRLLTRVRDIMRAGDRLALVSPGDTVAAALEAMRASKSGAVIAVDPSGGLAGIFTHGDFVRGYQQHRDLADHAVGDHMTRDPVSIQEDRLAAEVVREFEQNPIDEIVVVDEARRVIGLVDIQDLSRAQIF
jgi:arabinose-5-phosphate isomerase